MRLAHAILMLLGLAAHAAGGEVIGEIPSAVDASRKYLFYLHGIAVELDGPDSYSKYFNKRYENTAISQALGERGYVVIAHVRPKGTGVVDFARKVTGQIRRLIGAGVAPRNIAVVGHSKGAFMAQFISGMVAEPEVAYALLGGCPMPETRNVVGVDVRDLYEKTVSWSKGRLRGRMLSLYDVNDEWMGTCDDLFKANPELTTREVVLRTGQPPAKGHGVFLTPDKRWVDPVLDWIVQ